MRFMEVRRSKKATAKAAKLTASEQALLEQRAVDKIVTARRHLRIRHVRDTVRSARR